ncbi:MAG: hypothetical protein HYY34_08290 [Chloroflexi bacterium]|nr:hypothetical protein [Chloroflexota bacterium]
MWALSHEDVVAAAFESEKRHYEDIAPGAIRAGLEIPETPPWQSLGDFYDTCEDMVASFESERPALASIPDSLRGVPLIARRIGR